MMRITIDLDEKQIRKVNLLTGIEKKSPAVAAAIEEFIRQKEREAFLAEILEGKTDYSTTNEEIEESTNWDSAAES